MRETPSGSKAIRDGVLLSVSVTLQQSMLEVAYARCERRGRLRLDKLLAEHGPELPLPELRVLLACLRAQMPRASRSCRACSAYRPSR